MHPISVCIIAKNEEQRIEKCLASIKPYGFEIVVVDTGSTDRTKEIASRYADKILDYVWCDDFSAARNYSLREASNNWILMLDCDEWIKSLDVEELDYFRKHHPDSVGVISRENLVTERGQLVLNNTDHTERFFNKKLYHYIGIIHEQLAPIRGNEFPCLLLHSTIEHTGYDMTPEERIAKSKRNLTLLHKQLEQEPENPYVYYQLGKGCEMIKDYQAACEYYGKGLNFDVDPSLAYVQAMVISYGNTLLYTGQEETALGFEQIYDEFATTADFVYLMGRIYMVNGMYSQAVEQFLKATTFETCKFHGANSFLSFYHIGLICEKLGDTGNALAYYRKCDDYPPALEKAAQLSSVCKITSRMEKESTMDKLISVIIPCYNVENYIDRCFDSLLNQTIGFDRLEIIMINDCSTDGTWDKLTAIEAEYPDSVMIVNCDENGHQGRARNIGLHYASAPYIGYVDSDDWIEPDMYEKLYEKMTAHKCDIVMCQNWRDTALSGQALAPKLTGEADRMFEINTADKRRIFIACGSIGYNVWDKLFAREFLIQNNIFFPEGLAYEDHFFSTLLYFYSKKVYILEERLYHYYVNPASTILSSNAAHHFDILTVDKMMWEECENRGFMTKYRKEVEYLFLTLCYLAAIKMISLRLTHIPYDFFLELREETLKRVPDYHNNPYIKDYVTELNQMLLKLLDLPISEQDLNNVCNSIRMKYGIS